MRYVTKPPQKEPHDRHEHMKSMLRITQNVKKWLLDILSTEKRKRPMLCCYPTTIK